jgi:hypothetical protein
MVRDSKDPHGPVLTFSLPGWQVFVHDHELFPADGSS